jgi:ABC-type dipeptide/oligopeptide/nickel transport system ATPase component
LFISHDLAAVRYLAHRVAVVYAGEIVELIPALHLYGEQSAHPYTRALQAASEGRSSPYQLKESLDLPAVGCPVAPRCPLAVSRCRTEHPTLRELNGNVVACHRAEEVLSMIGPEASAVG